MSLSWTIAIEALSWIELERLTEDAAIRKTVKQLKVNDKETVNRARTLVFETVRRQNTLDYIAKEALEPQSLDNLKIGVRSYVRLFTYLAHFSGASLADAYGLSEHVKDLFRPKEMRIVDSAIDQIPLLDVPNNLGKIDQLAFNYFHPQWYIKYLTENFGDSMTEDLIKHHDIPQYLRINTLKSGETEVEDLISEGFQLKEEPHLNHAYRVIGGEGLTDTDGYRAGRCVIQDKASLLVSEVAEPKQNEIVLDVCAAPGVKTSHMAQMMDNTGKILSVDYNLRRLKSWESLMYKLGVTNAKPLHADATRPGAITPIEADLVVVDPPCTGSGTFHKVPSSKWRLTRRSIETMAGLQRKILANSSSFVKDGGTLVYSTCSITVDENEGVVNHFLSNNTEFTLVEASPRIGVPGLNGLDKAQRLYPHMHDCNGFFISKLVKSL